MDPYYHLSWIQRHDLQRLLLWSLRGHSQLFTGEENEEGAEKGPWCGQMQAAVKLCMCREFQHPELLKVYQYRSRNYLCQSCTGCLFFVPHNMSLWMYDDSVRQLPKKSSRIMFNVHILGQSETCSILTSCVWCPSRSSYFWPLYLMFQIQIEIDSPSPVSSPHQRHQKSLKVTISTKKQGYYGRHHS